MKWVAWIAGGLLIGVFSLGVWSYHQTLKTSVTLTQNPQLSQLNPVWVGYQANGKIGWRVQARSGQSTEDPSHLIAKQIVDGQIFDSQGKVLLQHLVAQTLEIHTHNRKISAGQATGEWIAKQKSLQVSSSRLDFDQNTGQGSLSEHVMLRQGKTRIELAHRATLNLNSGVFVTTQDVTYATPTVNIHAQALTFALGTPNYEFQNKVQFKTGNRKINCDKMSVAAQSSQLTFSGQVRFSAPNLNELISKSNRKKVQKPDWLKTIQSPIQIEAKQAKIQNSTLTFEGQVVVTQPHQHLTCDCLIIESSSGLVVGRGSVKWQRPHHLSVEAQAITLNVTQEKAEASQKVKTLFFQKKTKKNG